MSGGINGFDWLVLFGTVAAIVAYGTYKTRSSNSVDSYLMGDRKTRWWSIGISIIATQASAITFLSIPGQAYADGLRFVQLYLGLPLAMIVLSVTAVPLYSRLKVYTAYQYLEERFNLNTRTLASCLFLLQRGLSTGITIYAPAIVLSAVLGWNLSGTILFIGAAVIIYSVTGGNRAVSVTHQLQMGVIFFGMAAAGVVAFLMLPKEIGLKQAVNLAGATGHLNAINLHFNIKDRYNIWSGIIGGFFLHLSYFGTDQSQVARYIGGASVTESRMGLLLNGLLKVPMQLCILSIGLLLFLLYQFQTPPLFFNQTAEAKVLAGSSAPQYRALQADFQALQIRKSKAVSALSEALTSGSPQGKAIKAHVSGLEEEAKKMKAEAKALIKKADPAQDLNDTDYVFITFILNYLPHGLIGLLLAVMFSAAMSSTASALTSLGGTSVVDVYQRLINPHAGEQVLMRASKGFTMLWGIIATGFALVAGMLENLIQAVNILGSLFYGTILGIFLCGFYLPYIKGKAVFIAAVTAEAVVLFSFFNTDALSYLWYNVIGCLLVAGLGLLLQFGFNRLPSNSVKS